MNTIESSITTNNGDASEEEKGPATILSTQDAEVGRMFPDPDAGLTQEEHKRLVVRLCLVRQRSYGLQLSYLYLLAFLDRTNIGNAKLDRLNQDLHMTAGQYNAALTVFFVSYAVFEPLTNVCLKRFGPTLFLPVIMYAALLKVILFTNLNLGSIIWGICMTFMGFCTNFSGMVAARWFLGLAEAGLFPGVNYYLSCWYKRDELGIRAAIFFSAAAMSGSFGGLLAAAISRMDGIGGRPGWAWIFILEGILTAVSGFVAFFFIEDFPDKARFLSETDRARVLRRLRLDQQASAGHEGFKMSYLVAGLVDWKMWLGMVAGLDLSKHLVVNQLLTVPPYAVAAVGTVFVGWVADRTHQRGLCNIVMSLFGIVGFSILLGSHSFHAQYAAVFLGALGIYPCVANTISWMANNIEGVYKRGVVLGFVIGWGNLNGVVSSNIYRAADAKTGYKPGHGVMLGYMTFFLFGGSILMHVLLRRENASRRAGQRDKWVAGKSAVEIEALGDMRPDFLYTL
ncbi:MAG: hypothetical protein M1818_001274 [Claussenomyces sp. TS43310]|nr:MAG: hypothetical protein M1818_001274 [Claussenomyces sp. TS43310]